MKTNVKTPKFPKLEGVIASKGFSYDGVGDAIGMKGQAFRRRMNGSVEFTLDEIIELCFFFECEFSDLFDIHQ